MAGTAVAGLFASKAILYHAVGSVQDWLEKSHLLLTPKWCLLQHSGSALEISIQNLTWLHIRSMNKVTAWGNMTAAWNIIIVKDGWKNFAPKAPNRRFSSFFLLQLDLQRCHSREGPPGEVPSNTNWDPNLKTLTTYWDFTLWSQFPTGFNSKVGTLEELDFIFALG